jgi:hypothetical protein
MTKLTRYEQVREKVLPRLVAYQEDLIKLDREAIEGYDGGFIHGSRDTGTDLLRFTGGHDLRGFDWATQFLFRSGANTLYLYGDVDGVREISREEALARVQKYVYVTARRTAAKEFEDLPCSIQRADLEESRYQDLLPKYQAIFDKL